MRGYAPLESGRDLATRIATGSLRPTVLIEECLTRATGQNPETDVFITLAPDTAREHVATLGADTRKTPLCGLPYAAKDMFLTAGIRTTAGSRVLADWVPDHDAAAIERLTQAGAVLIGKANQHEFAHGITGENAAYGTVANPWDDTRLAGGSSSGSAAAVARGLASFALGTDTGGSCRVPAALCGVVGLKPTYGRVSTYGVIPYSWSLDHVGILAGTVETAAMVLQCLAGFDPRDANCAELAADDYLARLDAGPGGLRVGVPGRFFFEQADPEILDAARTAAAVLQEQGATLVDVELPSMDQARTVSLLVQMPEALSYHRRHLPEKLDLYGADLRAGLAFGEFILAEHYVSARRMIERYRQGMAAVFIQVDVILTPTSPIVAPPIGTTAVVIGDREMAVGDALTRYTGLFNMTGDPALSVPAGLHSSGLPMAVQIVGRPFEEATIVQVGRALEKSQQPLPRAA